MPNSYWKREQEKACEELRKEMDALDTEYEADDSV